ncbi:cation diffusion facilitator family transporter [Capnocytophaga sp. oral taxon 338]|uniref:cation diffusion facilitator family transporter n=1 Tax=Capnocytophaga sp. oral taxon 338 TaxID=710239 RepID=UPI000202FB78|nr:cation diffusion facilitator family transporter [Capnocytophaga sp. oral taxon 338]EGD34364.1 CDF family cation diffusion facilitator [Capnocytophaga sp. oral taxon 338 str. F0234]
MEKKSPYKTICFSIFGNLGLAGIKISAGILGNSYALIADGIESVSDVFSSSLVFFGLKYAEKPADKNHPYGHGKIEPLITFLVVGFLIASALLIAYQGYQNILTPQKSPKAWTLILLGIIILWKEINYRVVLSNSKLTGSTSLKADAWHHRSDAITSVAAFIGISISLLFGEGFETADDWAALFASGIILFNAYLIFRPALGEILDEDVYEGLSLRIKEIAKDISGVMAVEKCHIRKAGMSYCVDIHIIVNGKITVKEGHDIAHTFKDTLQKRIPSLTSILIHVEPDYRDICLKCKNI